MTATAAAEAAAWCRLLIWSFDGLAGCVIMVLSV